MTFGEKLQALRKKEGLSQEQIAGEIGVSRQAISKWETGESLPDVERVCLLSDRFGVTTDYLLKDIPPEDAGRPRTGEAPEAAPAAEEGNRRKGERLLTAAGVCAVTFALLGYGAVWLLSRIYPAPICCYNEETGLWKVGMENFIWVHSLEGFMNLVAFAFVAGVCLLLRRRFVRAWKWLFAERRKLVKRCK